MTSSGFGASNNRNSSNYRSHDTSGTSQRPIAPFTMILKSRIKQPQFYWFLGHFFTLYHFLKFHLSFFSIASQKYHYRMILLNISITYGIVLYQFLKSGQLKLTWSNIRENVRTLDNLQYFIMLSTLFICSILSGGKVSITGASYAPVIFSIFHCLNYFKENLLPFLPISPQLKSVLNRRITLFLANYNEKFLTMAQTFEIMCALRVGLFGLPMTLLKIIFNFHWNNLLSLIVIANYVIFFKLRLLQSESMKLLLNQVILRVDNYLLASPNMMQFQPFWLRYKQLVARLYDLVPPSLNTIAKTQSTPKKSNHI
ncbi:hypothetical protein NCAS_0J00370 [Naumovozyma castellii]|uniref:Nucleoporin POM33 n=1 Tax=Naumovozyma castellii TaxID=27288 RepID=G0VKI1_NAUCA|nr:hypothetical protein NCAS_0J00370 [Naumovozyma castellii CBS 4309]CCC72016.1 hypothetical protein NCAS_0J00370 [Naumovozyma castellii CBS 4309]